MNKKIITVVVSSINYSEDYDDNGNKLYSEPELVQQSYTWEDFLLLPEVVDLLREAGYYNKSEVCAENFNHLNKFVYKYGDYNQYTDNINCISHCDCNKLVVYQEVVGPERIKQVGKLIAKRFEYLRKESERVALKAEKAKQRKLEKARKLLEKEGLVRG